MANETIKWKFLDDCGDSLEVEQRNTGIAFYTDCERWNDVVVPFDKMRELHKWLGEKLGVQNDGK